MNDADVFNKIKCGSAFCYLISKKWQKFTIGQTRNS